MLNQPKIVASAKRVVFRYHKVKTNEGRLREKIVLVLFVLTACIDCIYNLRRNYHFSILLATCRFFNLR
jgi:hypothetical protein